MKRQALTVLLLCLFAGAAAAGFSVGRPAAVKKQVLKLDAKVHARLLAGAAGNRAPVISAVTAISTTVAAGGLARITVLASDPGDTLTYVWTSTTGARKDLGATTYWLAPSTPGVYMVNCVVSDGETSTPGGIAIEAVNPGTIKWGFSPSASVDVPPGIAADGTVYAAAAAVGDLYAIKPDGSQKWAVPFSTVGHDPFTTSFGPVVGADGTIYVVTSPGNKVYAVNPDGTPKWGPSSPVVTGVSFAPVVAADGTVYLYDDSKVLYMLSPVDGAGVSTFTALTNIDGPPVIGGDGTIYLKADPVDTLYYVSPVYGLSQSTVASVPAIQWPPAIGGDGTVYWLDTTDGANTALRALDSSGNPKWGVPYVPVGVIGLPPVIGPDGAAYILADISLYRVTATTDTVTPFTAFSDVASQFTPGPGGAVYAVDTVNESLYGLDPYGAVMWGPVLPAGGANILTAPRVGADGMVYFNADDGSVYAVYSVSALP